MKLEFRRLAVFAPFPGRVGLSEQQVADGLRPRTGRLVLLGAVGLSADYSRRPSLDEVIDRRLEHLKFVEVTSDVR